MLSSVIRKLHSSGLGQTRRTIGADGWLSFTALTGLGFLFLAVGPLGFDVPRPPHETPPEASSALFGPAHPQAAPPSRGRMASLANDDSFTLEWSSTESHVTSDLAWGDYDGDGDLDLAVGNDLKFDAVCGCAVSEPAQLYRNHDGLLALAWSAPINAHATSVAWGDYDNDGDLDLVIGNTNTPNHLYRNDNATLTLAWSAPVTHNTQSLAWGDVDGDGDLDLAVGVFSASSYIYGNEDGILTTTQVWTSTEASGATSLAWGDYDNDGDLDLAAGDQTGFNHLYANTGVALTTSAVWTSTQTNSAQSVAWGDYDQDGYLDLLVGTSRGGITSTLHLYQNNAGVLTTSGVWTPADTNYPTSVSWGDFDGDRDLDVLVSNECVFLGPLTLCEPQRVYLNNTGLLATSAHWASPEVETANVAIWGDYDGDGDLDIATGGEFVRLYANRGRALQPGACTASGFSRYAQDNAWGDNNRDGYLDLAEAIADEPFYGYTDLFTNDPAGIWLGHQQIGDGDGFAQALAWGDVDGDGDLDLAIGMGTDRGDDGFAYPVRLYQNDGPDWTNTWSSSNISSTNDVAWADVDNDGDLDLAAVKGGQAMLYANSNGTLLDGQVWAASEPDAATALAWGDYDNDGDLDLATSNRGLSRLYRNHGGVLANRAVWLSADGFFASDLDWGDYDQDGYLDLAIVGDGPIRLYRNEAGQLTTTPVWVSVGLAGANQVAWGDYDGDGDLDLAVPGAELYASRIYLNKNGALTDWIAAPSGGLEPSSILWGDYDNDGDLDLAIGNSAGLGTCFSENTQDALSLPGAVPIVYVPRPGANADAYSLPNLNSQLISIPYTLTEVEGRLVKGIQAYFSLNGGGQWFPAIAASNTVTANLSSRIPERYDTHRPITISDQSIITSSVYVAGSQVINDVDVWVNIAHTFNSDLDIYLVAPDGTAVELATDVGGDTDGFANTIFDDSAATSIVSGTWPFTGRFRPEGNLSTLTGKNSFGRWNLRISDDASGDTGVLVAWGLRLQTGDVNAGQHVFVWDVFQSGFFGQSDNVVFRIEAIPSITLTPGDLPGPYLYGSYASSTFPFRVRGTQVRVMSDTLTATLPLSTALVYRLPAGQLTNAQAMADGAGRAFHTDGQGYLQGRGQLNIGDQLVALLPITWTDSYTLYHTSATPTFTGLQAFTVITPGVQTLTVSSANQLALFNLDLSLEWDARLDSSYLAQLEFNLQKTSDYLYDATDGQAALGTVRIFFNRDHWDTAHLRLYANNRLRPFAAIGGVVSEPLTEPVTSTVVYLPGQVHMAATWNRYGNPGVTLGEDWPRTLAHELGHYLFFQDDNYLGLDAENHLIPINTCSGTLMSDPYRDDYSEFKLDADWLPGCANTLAHLTTGRSDWATVNAFYPMSATVENLGPTIRPLDVTEIVYVYPITPTQALVDPRFYLTYNGASYQPDKRARAFLLQSDRLVDLGSPVVDQVLARGAALTPISDTVCVFEPTANRQGCKTIINASDQQLPLTTTVDWQPDIVITPVSTQTVSVLVSHVPTTGLTLTAKLYANTGPVSGEQPLVLMGDDYTTTFVFTDNRPVLGGYVYVRVSSDPVGEQRASITEYALGGNPANARSGFANARSGFANARSGFAPVVSGDGQVILYTPGLTFPVGTFYAVQAATYLPDVPSWASVVGKGYRILASAGAPDMGGASMSVSYAKNDVPLGGEPFLRVYAYDAISQTWTALTSTVNIADSSVVASLDGPGLYAVMTAIEIPLYGPGWNLVAYPIQGAQPVTDATQSIAGYFTTLYGYVVTDTVDPWKLYDVNVPTWVNDLHRLEFGHGYWLTATTDIIWRLNGEPAGPAAVASLAAVPAQVNAFGLPPATYYGVVQPSGFFTPTPGLRVAAYIDGVLCGQGATLSMDGEVVYSVNVSAAGSDAPGCGQSGAIVTFWVEPWPVGVTSLWDNNHPIRLDLSLGGRLYLPIISE